MTKLDKQTISGMVEAIRAAMAPLMDTEPDIHYEISGVLKEIMDRVNRKRSGYTVTLTDEQKEACRQRLAEARKKRWN